MRFFFGIVVGVFLTIGVAYVSDASLPGATTTGAATQTSVERPMVNWDVVSANWHHFTVGVRSTWNKLATR